MKKSGQICKLCALIQVRIVKSYRSEGFVLCRSKISGKFCFKSMNLGMFDRFYPSLKTRVLIDERRFDMNSERYVIPRCIERMFGIPNGCRILERIFCKLVIVILVCSTRKVGDCLRESED